MANNAGNEKARRSTSKYLAEFGKKSEALKLLLQLSITTEKERVQYDVGVALYQIGNEKEAEKVLINFARSTKFIGIKKFIEILEKYSDKIKAAKSLLDLTNGAEEEWVRSDSVMSLCKLGVKEEFVLQDLVRLLKTYKDEGVRENAL